MILHFLFRVTLTFDLKFAPIVTDVQRRAMFSTN